MRQVEVRQIRGEIEDVPADQEPTVALELADEERVVALDFTLWPQRAKKGEPETRKYVYTGLVEKTIERSTPQ